MGNVVAVQKQPQSRSVVGIHAVIVAIIVELNVLFGIATAGLTSRAVDYLDAVVHVERDQWLGSTVEPLVDGALALLEVRRAGRGASKFGLSENGRMEGSRSEARGVFELVVELILDKTQLPVGGQRGVNVIKIGSRRNHIESNFQFRRSVGVGHNSSGHDGDFRDENFSPFQSINQQTQWDAAPILSVGTNAHNLDVCRVLCRELVRCGRTGLSSTDQPAIVVGGKNVLVVTILHLVQVKGLLMRGRIWMTARAIACQTQAEKGQSIDARLVGVQNRRHLGSSTTMLVVLL
mmetsp:Transcript_27725/g.76297  ORF Transcript_27725/g.76297 Transcript_27725/m.76297 type:complete len:292 (+) Transcript_27725:636-1511(+)